MKNDVTKTMTRKNDWPPIGETLLQRSDVQQHTTAEAPFPSPALHPFLPPKQAKVSSGPNPVRVITPPPGLDSFDF